jgi:hypothetical protein
VTIQSYRLSSFSEEKSDWHLPEVALYVQDKMFIVHIGGVMVSVLALSAVDCGFVHFVLDQHTELDFYSASSLKQQSADRHVAPLGHIILIPSQPAFALSP